jgi:hypothetical protein
MAFVRRFSLNLISIAVINKPLEIGMSSSVWRYALFKKKQFL